MTTSKRESLPDLYVLDALANDIEDLESIMRILNSNTILGWHGQWGRAFAREEIVEALTRLVNTDQVRVAVVTPEGKALTDLPHRQLPPASYDDVWYGMTAKGRIVHSNWNPKLGDQGP